MYTNQLNDVDLGCVQEDVNLDSNLYGYILSNIEEFNAISIYYLLGHHELNIMARYLQDKFPSSNYSISDIKKIIKEELS